MVDTKIMPIKNFNCAKVLPLVYDESLSYYESICKLVSKVNEVVNVYNNTIDDKINEIIDTRFEELMLLAMYNEQTETLTLTIGERA